MNENDELIINIFNVVIHENSEKLCEGHEDSEIIIFDDIVFNSSYLKELLTVVAKDL